MDSSFVVVGDVIAVLIPFVYSSEIVSVLYVYNETNVEVAIGYFVNCVCNMDDQHRFVCVLQNKTYIFNPNCCTFSIGDSKT